MRVFGLIHELESPEGEPLVNLGQLIDPVLIDAREGIAL